MSCNYAEGLSDYADKGKLGLDEIFDTPEQVKEKVKILADWLKKSKHAVFHTGAGISTSAGIPDFRGPNGVWTLEKQGKKPSINVSWDEAVPTVTHMALCSLQKAGFLKYVITQNIDGLHLRSGFPREQLGELHGNMFTDKCTKCNRQFVRSTAAKSVGQKSTGVKCPGRRHNGTKCRGTLNDTILDWEHDLPNNDLNLSDTHSCASDLSICLGTTLQIVPSGSLPLETKKRGGKLVICNLQPTKHDRHADLIIHSYVDDIMKEVLNQLNVPLMSYEEDDDPVKSTCAALRKLNFGNSSSKDDWPEDFVPIDWSLKDKWANNKELQSLAKQRKAVRMKNLKSPVYDEPKMEDVKRPSPGSFGNSQKRVKLENPIKETTHTLYGDVQKTEHTS